MKRKKEEQQQQEREFISREDRHPWDMLITCSAIQKVVLAKGQK
jgi:hypothetical protein